MATKTSVCKKVYVTKDGKEVRSAASADHNAEDIDRLEFRFADGGPVRKVTLADFKDKDVIRAATWHGFAQKLGDAYSGSKKAESDPVEDFDNVFENLVGGLWVEKGAGAGEAAPSLIIEAVMAAMEKAGTPGNRDKIEAKLSPRDGDGNLDKPAAKKAREGALANPAIKAEYEAAKAARAAERAKKAAAEAKTAGKEAAADLGSFM